MDKKQKNMVSQVQQMWTSLESVFTGWESPRIPKGLISEDSRVQGICGRIWDDLGEENHVTDSF